MTGVITTGNYPKALWPGLAAIWGRLYAEHPKEYMDLYDKEMSYKSYEEDIEATGFGLAPVKAQGGSVSYDSETQGTVTRYTNVAYGLGFIVTREEIADNLYEEVGKKRTQALFFSMAQTKENNGANPYNRAFNPLYTYGDGVQLITDAHPTLSGPQSNILATGADLSEAALEEMNIQIMEARNSRGLKIALQAESLHIAPNNWFEANRILGSVLQNDTGNNAVNVLKATSAVRRGVFVNHYFTDPGAWFLRTNAPRGMVCFQREELDFSRDNDFDTSNMKAQAYERYSFGASDFRGIYGSPGV